MKQLIEQLKASTILLFGFFGTWFLGAVVIWFLVVILESFQTLF